MVLSRILYEANVLINGGKTKKKVCQNYLVPALDAGSHEN